MAENKLTDKEIIKALECCSKNDAMLCYDCPFLKNCSRGFISRNALDLINRQQAEIEEARNGACIQVTTQRGAWGTWNYALLQMSKKLFKDLKKHGLIFVDEKETEKINRPYKNPWLTYYRFDIDRMIENGYKVVCDDGE